MTHRIYLDYCATTPIHPDVQAAMLQALAHEFGNPSSMHWAGRQAANLVMEARQQVAAGIGCQPHEVVFTSGATEADNLALFGVLRQFPPEKAHLITTRIEHHAILHPAQQLEREGYAVTYLPVDGQGWVDPTQVAAAIRPDTVLISVMLVNNEVGAIQPVAEIAALARAHGILFHTDAVQGIGLLPVDVNDLQVDLLSLTAHKLYGPKGAGALFVRTGVSLEPLLHGGPQERALRPGTENVPGIVGLGSAVQLARQHREQERARLAELRASLVARLRQVIPGLQVNGPPPGQVSPHVLSLSFPGADAEMMLVRLNGAGVAVSLGSACTSKTIEPSHVLSAMGLPLEQINATLRLSFGYWTNLGELNDLIDLLPGIWEKSLVAG